MKIKRLIGAMCAAAIVFTNTAVLPVGAEMPSDNMGVIQSSSYDVSCLKLYLVYKTGTSEKTEYLSSSDVNYDTKNNQITFNYTRDYSTKPDWDSVSLWVKNYNDSSAPASDVEMKFSFFYDGWCAKYSDDEEWSSSGGYAKLNGAQDYQVSCDLPSLYDNENIKTLSYIGKIKDFEVKGGSIPEKHSLDNATVKVSNKTYTGKVLIPAVTVTLDGKTLKSGTDYTVSYKNNKNCGKATVTVTGKGGYTGSKSGSFIIKPAKVSAKKLTSPKKNTIKLTWTKAKGGVTGYQVMTATNKKFSKGKKTYNVKASAASKTINKLKKGTKYFAKVRAYKTVGKTKYYGAWSAVKSVKCK